MASGKKHKNYRDRVEEAVISKQRTFAMYERKLLNIATSMWEYEVPDTVDVPFLERTLIFQGRALLFKDPDIGWLALPMRNKAGLDIYNRPLKRVAYAANGYRFGEKADELLTEENSVIIYNNMLRTNSIEDIRYYAEKLAEIDQILDVNLNAQKFSILIRCSKEMRVAMLNAYEQYEAGVPVIFGDERMNTTNAQMQAINTAAPAIFPQLQQHKNNIWNEALTAIGIPNVAINKKERLITDEVERSMGGANACRYARELPRQEGMEHARTIWKGTTFKVAFREEAMAERDRYKVDNQEEQSGGDE